MKNNTIVPLDPHFQQFIAHQIETGRYASVADAVHSGLRLLEDYVLSPTNLWLGLSLNKCG